MKHTAPSDSRDFGATPPHSATMFIDCPRSGDWGLNRAFQSTTQSASRPQHDIAATSDGTLHVADPRNFCICKVTAGTGEVTPFAAGSSYGYAEGAIASALFEEPRGLALGGDGKIPFVTESSPSRVRKTALATGGVSLVTSSCSGPYGLTATYDGEILYVAEASQHN